MFGTNMSLPSSDLKDEPSEKSERRRHERKLVSSLAYISTLKVEATYSSETSVVFQRATQRFASEDTASITSVVGTSDSLIQFNIAFVSTPTLADSPKKT
jgi:hypothetical protein